VDLREVHKRYLFERITRPCVFSLCFPAAAAVFCVLFSVALTDVVVMLSSLCAPLICVFRPCWIS
jgi:hypothetical protein